MPNAPEPRTPCPHCKQPAPAQANLCVACGYDFSTGKRLVTERREHAGLYRDRHMLVVDCSDAQFPDRCLWDNRATDGSLTRVTAWYLPPSVGGTLGSIAAKKTTRMSIPVCASCQQRAAKRSRVAYTIAALSAIVTVVALVFVVLAQGGQPPWIAGGVSLAGFVVALLGLIVGKANQDADDQLQVVFFDDQQIWLPRVSQDFLKDLPAWSGDPLRHRQTAAHR